MSIVSNLQTGWRVFRRHPTHWITVALALGLAQLIAMVALQQLLPARTAWLGLLGISGLFEAGLLNAARRAARGYAPGLRDAFAPFVDRPLDYLLVGLVAKAGLVLAFVGVFASATACLFAPLFVAERLPLRDALALSAQLGMAAPAHVAGLTLAIIALNFAGSLVLGFGLVLTAPVSAIAIVIARKELAPLLLRHAA